MLVQLVCIPEPTFQRANGAMPQSTGQAVRQIQACIKEVLAAPKRCEREVLTVCITQITCARGMAPQELSEGRSCPRECDRRRL